MGFEPMTSGILVQRSWIQILYSSSVVFLAVRIAWIHFFTAVHIYDFHIFIVVVSKSVKNLSMGAYIWKYKFITYIQKLQCTVMHKLSVHAIESQNKIK